MKYLTFVHVDGRFIKQWQNWTGEVPQAGDYVKINFCDYGENEYCYVVERRIIDWKNADCVTVVVR